MQAFSQLFSNFFLRCCFCYVQFAKLIPFDAISVFFLIFSVICLRNPNIVLIFAVSFERNINPLNNNKNEKD